MVELEVTTETDMVMKEDGGKLKAQTGKDNDAEIITSDAAEMSIEILIERKPGLMDSARVARVAVTRSQS